MLSGILTEEQCRRRISAHHAGLYWTVATAHTRALKALSEMKLQRPDASFRSHLIHQLMVDNARTYFGGTSGVEVIDRAARRRNSDTEDPSDRFFIRFGRPGPEAMICQFKKFDADFRTRNYPTRTAIAFDRQLPLENIPLGFRFTAGYQVDETGTVLTTVAIVCPGRLFPNWWYELEPVERVGETVTANPLQPARVRVKKPQADLPIRKGNGPEEPS